MEKDDKGSTLIRIGVSGRKFLLVPAYPGCPGSKAVKRSLLWMKPWASAHRGKWGQLNLPWKNGWKIKKWKHAKRAVFYVYVKFWEQSGQAGVENGAMLPHIYSDILPNAPICSQIFTIFFASGGNRHWPPNQNPVDALGWSRSYFYVHVSKMLWNNAWSAGYFITEWKQENRVVIPKIGKDNHYESN